MNVLLITIKAILAILAADLFTGFVHWMEDTFWTEETPLIGKWLIQPNELHHRKPTAFLEKNWWQSSYDAVITALLILVAAYLLNQLNFMVWVFALTGCCATQIHKYSHQPKSRLPGVIRMLQKIRIIQDNRHHAKHHVGKKDTYYCLITPVLNPLLDRVHFWIVMQKILTPVFGKSRR
jgi:ubiquitin-conjugating enzyme E2 variant